MGVYESHSKIKKAADDMEIVWQRTKAFWKDAKAEQFERDFIEPLEGQIKMSQSALENIGITLNQIRSELKETEM